jgi:hypothetical protein
VEEILNALRQSAETSCTHIMLENAIQRKDSEITCWSASVSIDIGNVNRVIQLLYDYIFCISYRASILSEGMGIYRCADKSLARPTSRCILFDGENISFDGSLVVYLNSTNIPPIMIINRLYETQNLLSL